MSATLPFVEVFSIGTLFPELTRLTTSAPDSEYLNLRELCPELAATITAGVAGVLERRLPALRGSLRTLYRLSPSANFEGKLEARCALVLLGDHSEKKAEVQGLRSHAAQVLAGLWRPTHRSMDLASTGFLQDCEAAVGVEQLTDGPLGGLLGHRLERTLAVHVAGRRSLSLSDRFASAPRRPQCVETFEVHRAILKSTETRGRYRSVAMEGLRDGLPYQVFNEQKVFFDESDQQVIASAVGDPSRRLRMTIARTTASNCTIKPIVTHSLSNLRLEETPSA